MKRPMLIAVTGILALTLGGAGLQIATVPVKSASSRRSTRRSRRT